MFLKIFMADLYSVHRTRLINIIGIRPIMSIGEAQEALEKMKKSNIDVYAIGINHKFEKLSESELNEIIEYEIEKQEINETF